MTLFEWVNSIVGIDVDFTTLPAFVCCVVSVFVAVYVLDLLHDLLDFVLDLVKRK